MIEDMYAFFQKSKKLKSSNQKSDMRECGRDTFIEGYFYEMQGNL